LPEVFASLFEMITVSGVAMSLAFVDDGNCAVMRDGAVVETLGLEGRRLKVALRRYFEMVKREGGARQAVHAIDLLRDPRTAPATSPRKYNGRQSSLCILNSAGGTVTGGPKGT
jgi:hypothetical protein